MFLFIFTYFKGEKIEIRPNTKPEAQRLLGIEIPGQKRYQVVSKINI